MIRGGRVRLPPPQLQGVKGGTVVQVRAGHEVAAHHDEIKLGVRQLSQYSQHPLPLQARVIHPQHVVVRDSRRQSPTAGSETASLKRLLQHPGIELALNTSKPVIPTATRSIAVEGVGEAVAEATRN